MPAPDSSTKPPAQNPGQTLGTSSKSKLRCWTPAPTRAPTPARDSVHQCTDAGLSGQRKMGNPQCRSPQLRLRRQALGLTDWKPQTPTCKPQLPKRRGWRPLLELCVMRQLRHAAWPRRSPFSTAVCSSGTGDHEIYKKPLGLKYPSHPFPPTAGDVIGWSRPEKEWPGHHGDDQAGCDGRLGLW